MWAEECEKLGGEIVSHTAGTTAGTPGYILEVHLEYPQELHDAHNAYPLAPERLALQKEWMSEYQQRLLGAPDADPAIEKLDPNIHDKEHYVLHYRNLLLYLSLGMRLKKVHRALRFDQRSWMELYIRMNTDIRKQRLREGPVQAHEQIRVW